MFVRRPARLCWGIGGILQPDDLGTCLIATGENLQLRVSPFGQPDPKDLPWFPGTVCWRRQKNRYQDDQ
jgi:hypothetical protein